MWLQVINEVKVTHQGEGYIKVKVKISTSLQIYVAVTLSIYGLILFQLGEQWFSFREIPSYGSGSTEIFAFNNLKKNGFP